jgi:triphosphoribosyl-dephospho-CoA synthase
MLLEVSAYPKPGNVHRTADFLETRYEHFLASAVAVAPHFKYAAKKGIIISTQKFDPQNIGIGAIIKEIVLDINSWQHGGNTLLGTILLLLPIAVAAGKAFVDKSFSITVLRENVKTIVESTTPLDAVNVYDALSIAKPGGLGSVQRFDVTDPSSKKEILANQVSLFEVFKIASKYDSIASEWVNNYHITFDLGFPYFTSALKETDDINVATVHTFLKILSEIPDTLITRKVGLKKSKDVSAQAKLVLEKGGLTNTEGRDILWSLDKHLRNSNHKLNPGTTADIIAAVLAVAILNGYRP